MNAVNLLPVTRRRHGVSLASPAFLGLVGALVVVLVATVLYVGAENRASAGRARLAQLTGGVAAWSSVAGSYAPASTEVAQRTSELADVRSLASSRFDWSDLLAQIAGVMPTHAQLSSLQAAAPVSATPGATATAGAATAAAAATPATGATSTTGGSTMQLSGCATSQAVVAATMVALHRVSGVSGVTLSSSSDSGSSAGSAGGASTAGGGCAFPVQFQLSLAFTSPATPTTPATATPASTTSSATSPGSVQ